MLRKTLILASIILALVCTRVVPAPAASAQQAISVVAEAPRNEFPKGVTFTVSFTAPAETKEARLRYQLAPDGTGASGVADCTGAATVNCSFTLTSGRGIFIIPGAEITYHWEITDAAGNKLSTPDALYVHDDTRFTFETLQRDNVTLYYHSGTRSQAQAVLDAVADTLDRVGALEKTQVTFPVKVFLYTTAEEMQPAIAPGGAGRGVQVLGEVVYSDTAMVSADVATLDIARHEVAHIVTREATKGPFEVPGWLNEGISVFSQARPLAGHDSALQAAIRVGPRAVDEGAELVGLGLERRDGWAVLRRGRLDRQVSRRHVRRGQVRRAAQDVQGRLDGGQGVPCGLRLRPVRA